MDVYICVCMSIFLNMWVYFCKLNFQLLNIHTHFSPSHTHIHAHIYLHKDISKLANCCQGQPKDSLFNSYYT